MGTVFNTPATLHRDIASLSACDNITGIAATSGCIAVTLDCLVALLGCRAGGGGGRPNILVAVVLGTEAVVLVYVGTPAVEVELLVAGITKPVLPLNIPAIAFMLESEFGDESILVVLGILLQP